MSLVETNIRETEIQEIFSRQRKKSIELRSEPLSNRKQRLLKLRGWIHQNRQRIHEAGYNDFRKPSAEVDALEIFHVLNEIKLAISALESWASPQKIDAPITMLGTRSWIRYEPKGVCLVISPWNYPFSLAIGPLVSALAAGNTVIIKPSEHTPHVSALIASLSKEIFDADVVSVVEGDAEVSKTLLQLRFDHIFFTGSPAIGKVVMRAAAENLTSVTLELGGKCPAVVTSTANLSDAAERVAVSKFVNNGQTCIAPDYVLVDEHVAAAFKEELVENIKKLFAVQGSFEASQSYCRIVNASHFDRITRLVNDAIDKGAKVDLGGNPDRETCFLPPIVLSEVPEHARILEEEIFGPVLPIVTYASLDEAIHYVNSKPKPLALYVFSTSNRTSEQILKQTTSGGACINDCAVHFLHHDLPFGGVNNSGIGKSHGRYGFLAFSNEKPVLRQKSGFIPLKMFYPPYTAFSKRVMDWFLKFF